MNRAKEKKNREGMAEVAAETKVQSKVIVAIDESECSSYALKWALQNLDDKLKSGLILFSVISIDYSGAFAGGYGSLRKLYFAPLLPPYSNLFLAN